MQLQKRLGFDIDIPDDFGHWLAGFVAGEGCFSTRHINTDKGRWLKSRFEICLRADDMPILQQIKDILEVGYLRCEQTRSQTNPMASYAVWKVPDLYHVIVPIFNKFPLRAKKAIEFDIWKQIVEIHYHAMNTRGARPRWHGGRYPHPDSFWDKVLPLVDQLSDTRVFSSTQGGK